ncbi:hypothetical protein F3Y22_tig00110410pilonHSYRG00013 [Hibiscus syriacus]|uniref:Uncharacterized protein n=1 Tax=Hibiscus syriacus TaxID=106335 RepID=A0A6A3AN14_HIBSY|nr:hypothetical protein F3Y22_tig00110410pilonHSYRG00013 [Hibiscus syriacus]
MEGKKKVGSSSSSFTSELFGSKDSPSPSTGIFGSIFTPPSKVLGRDSLHPAGARGQPWNTNPGPSGDSSKGHEGENRNVRDESYIYQEQRVQPCPLSSSIYYGGQDESTNMFSYHYSTRKMVEKMIRGVQQEETGGKGLHITKSSFSSQHTHIKVPLVRYP